MAPITLRVVVFVLASLFAASGSAEDGPRPGTRWECWIDGNTRILCRLESAVPAEAAESPAPPPTSPARAPSGRLIRMSPLAHAILDTPDRLQRRTIAIPVFGSNCSRAAAEQLAEAVMCGGRRDCEVGLLSPFEAFVRQLDEFGDAEYE